MRFTSHRVVFEVARTLSKHPDPAQITIYNLAPQVRSSWTGGEQVRLVVGYAENAGLVYSGTLHGVTVARDGGSIATALSCRDGDAAFRATVSQAFGAQAPLSLVVGRLVSAMGLTLGPGSVAALAGLSARGSLVQVGLAQQALDEVLTPVGLRYVLQDGAVYVMPSAGATSEEAVLLSPSTGLVGSPESMTDRVPKVGAVTPRLRVTSLLQPALRPGRRVVLESTTHAGVYRCDTVRHKGDSEGQDWYSVAEVSVLA